MEPRNPAAQQRSDDVAHQRNTQGAFDKLLIHPYKGALVVEQRAARIPPVYGGAGKIHLSGMQVAYKAIRYGPARPASRMPQGISSQT